jgi:hypothetical protein
VLHRVEGDDSRRFRSVAVIEEQHSIREALFENTLKFTPPLRTDAPGSAQLPCSTAREPVIDTMPALMGVGRALPSA